MGMNGDVQITCICKSSPYLIMWIPAKKLEIASSVKFPFPVQREGRRMTYGSLCLIAWSKTLALALLAKHHPTFKLFTFYNIEYWSWPIVKGNCQNPGNPKRLMFDVNQIQQTVGAYGWSRKKHQSLWCEIFKNIWYCPAKKNHRHLITVTVKNLPSIQSIMIGWMIF